MRNLKRALSLALASVMLLGMMVVGTSAAGYPDVDAQDNLEAIEVMQLLGVMAGDDNGNFNPDKYVTRNEMAVIMTHMLKLNAGGTTPFTDVPAWAQPYVAACYANGVVSGTSATTYGGNDNVTAAQAGLMVMKALGYFTFQGEFKNDWQLAVATRASKISLFDGISAGVSAPLTRNEVAKLCLNALQADVVVAEEHGGLSVEGNGISVSENATYTYTAVARTDKDYANRQNDGKQQLVEKLFDAKVQKNNSGALQDDFGRPCTQWTYAGKTVKSAKSADAIYTAEVKAKAIYNDLGMSNDLAAGAVDTYTDGSFNLTNDKGIKKNDTDTKWGGNGTTVEVYKSTAADGTINGATVVVVNTYVGEINKVAAAKGDDAAYVNVTAKNGGYSGKFETEAFAKDDVVLYTAAKTAADKTEIKTMKPAEKVAEVKVSKVSGGDSFVAAGTTYKYDAKVAAKLTAGDVDSILDLYLDEAGYVIYTKEFKSSSSYAYVLKAGQDTDRYDANAYYAKLLLSDGTVSEVKLNKDKLTDAQKANIASLKGLIVSYTKNSKDEYTLTDMNATAATAKVEVKKGETKVTVGDATYYANAKTLFLVQKGKDDKATYTAYTGYANVPTLKAASATATVYCKSGNLATVIFVKDAAVTSSTKDIVYILGSKAPTTVNDTDAGTYYNYKAVVNGEITTIDVDANLGGVDKLFSAMVYDDYNIAQIADCTVYSTDSKDDNYTVTGAVTAEAENDTIAVGGVYYALSSNVQVYEVKGGDKIETATLADLVVADVANNVAASNVQLVINSGEVVTIFCIH